MGEQGKTTRAGARGGATRITAQPAAAAGTGHVNEVRLVGRLAAAPVRRSLPSGDELVTFRLVVDRSAPRPRRDDRAATSAPSGTGRPQRVTGSPRTPTVDTLDCAAWRKDVQRTVERAATGDVLEITGALRRRFWRSPAGGPASRSEVEVASLKRLRRAEA